VKSAMFVPDTIVLARRNFKRLLRTPQILAFATIQPVMFVLLFRYVFGADILFGLQKAGWKYEYADYLIPGILVQVTSFGSIAAAVGIAADMGSGIMDRFRSLPMSQAAVLTGRTVSDIARQLMTVTIILIVGTMVGFRFHNGIAGAVGAIGMALLFGFAMAWFFAWVGLRVTDAEAVQTAGFIPIFPLVFLSGAFTPITGLPPILEAFARNQPLTHVVSAIRGLAQGSDMPLTADTNHHIIMATIWCVGSIVIFGYMSIRKFTTAA